jgi:hypothetical protein
MLRRGLLIAALVLVVGAPADALAGKTTTARVIECKTGDSAETRSATFMGRMRTIAGSDHMTMRFTLLERFGDEKLHPVALPELRFWRQSRPGIREFRYKQTVTGLEGGGQYRTRVEFRWLDASGNLVRKAQKTTPACYQPGLLANLKVGSPSAQPGAGGTAVYIVPIQNPGALQATDVAVELFVDGAATNVGHIDSIPAGETREVRFTGPICKRRLRAVADPADSVKETLESDNALTLSCPALAR